MAVGRDPGAVRRTPNSEETKGKLDHRLAIVRLLVVLAVVRRVPEDRRHEESQGIRTAVLGPHTNPSLSPNR
jgi:hypothetical protein